MFHFRKKLMTRISSFNIKKPLFVFGTEEITKKVEELDIKKARKLL